MILAQVAGPVFALILIPVLILLYLLPCIVATTRRNPHSASIAVINIFLGWTLIGWVVALAWALMPVPAESFRDERLR